MIKKSIRVPEPQKLFIATKNKYNVLAIKLHIIPIL